MKMCNAAADELRSLGAHAISLANSLNIKCEALADDFVERGVSVVKEVEDFATFVHQQATQVGEIRAKQILGEARRLPSGGNGAHAPTAVDRRPAIPADIAAQFERRFASEKGETDAPAPWCDRCQCWHGPEAEHIR
jgi:hypothetical protein